MPVKCHIKTDQKALSEITLDVHAHKKIFELLIIKGIFFSKSDLLYDK